MSTFSRPASEQQDLSSQTCPGLATSLLAEHRGSGEPRGSSGTAQGRAACPQLSPGRHEAVTASLEPFDSCPLLQPHLVPCPGQAKAAGNTAILTRGLAAGR